MEALRFHGVDDLRLDTVPDPLPAAGEVLVAVEVCGVCGSDLHLLDGSARPSRSPLILGHEIAGRVEAATEAGWTSGDLVVVHPGAACGACPRCREGRANLCESRSVLGIDTDGGLAAWISVSGDRLVTRPPELSAAAAATSVDAGATAYHAVSRRGHVGSGDAVLVIGVGGLGGYAVQIARHRGAAPIVAADTDPAALQRARRWGADEIVLVEAGEPIGRRVKLLTDGGVDVAFDFVGAAAALDAAVKSLRTGGRAVAVGVSREPLRTIPPVLWATEEYTLSGAYGSLPGDVAVVLAGLAEGSLEPPPMQTVGLAEAATLIPSLARGELTVPGRLMVAP